MYNNETEEDYASRKYSTTYSCKVHEWYFDYEIRDRRLTREFCQLARSLEQHDKLLVRFDTPGGDVGQAILIMNAIAECKGTVIGSIEREAASAGSMLFLSCDEYQVMPYGYMMIHTSSYGIGGKSPDIEALVDYYKKDNRKIMEDVYKGFLTKKEIDSVIQGREMYFDAEDIIKRLEKVKK